VLYLQSLQLLNDDGRKVLTGGRSLDYEDLEYYCKVVTALSETIRLIAEIDAAIPNWPIE
jgi:hypothetical protein